MKIVKMGEANKAYVWKTKCSTCESILEFVNGNDPLCGKEVCYNCDASQYYTRYVCPVCHSHKVAFTNSAFGKKGNAEYDKRVVKKGEFDLPETMENPILTDEDVAWIENRSRYWSEEAN